MNYLKFFPSKYINAADLDGQDDILVTIRTLGQEEVQNSEGGSEQKPVLLFENSEKRLILNRTNAETVAGLYGGNIDHWAGKQILLFIEKDVFAFGKKWDVIRIRGHIPPSSSSNPTGGAASLSIVDSVSADASSPSENDLPF
jgi:hypothetical protein